MLVCTSCGVHVHELCTDGYGTKSSKGTWCCAACLEKRATQCCFCETKSSQLFRRPTYPNCFSWVHTVCLHAHYTGLNDVNKKRKVVKRKNVEESDDSDEEVDVCAVCADDEFRRVDLQRVSYNVIAIILLGSTHFLRCTNTISTSLSYLWSIS